VKPWRGAINFHYFIVNASLISATSETRKGRKERHEGGGDNEQREERGLKREEQVKTLGMR